MKINKHEENMKNWEFVRNLTNEEKVELGYKATSRAIYKCTTCGAVKYIIPSHFKTRRTVCDNGCHGLPSGCKVIPGLNDLATTHPHLVEYFVDEQEATRVSKGSMGKIKLKCPKCGYTRNIACYSFVDRGFKCHSCSDGFPYGERYMANLLHYLNLEFKTQYKIEGYSYRYDFFVPSLNLIIETHGQQHYIKSFETMGGETLEEIQKNDKIKEKLAKERGYNFIVIDCRYGTASHLKKSILETNLEKLIDLDSVQWEEVARNSEETLVSVLCEYYGKTGDSTYAIAERFGISSTTASRYLKKGQEIGLCTFIPKETKPNKVVMVDKTKIIRVEDSVGEMSRKLQYEKSCIVRLVSNKGATGKGKGHFTKSKKLGYVGFYYIDSEEWKLVKNNYSTQEELIDFLAEYDYHVEGVRY